MMTKDIEKLIMFVEKRPALYNARLKEYTDKHLRRTLWLEVCQEMTENWKDLGDKERNVKCEKLQKKWKNLRTCFNREYNAQKNEPSDDTKRRKYIYFNKLLFLRDTIKRRNTSNKFEPSTSDVTESETEDIEDASPKPDYTLRISRTNTFRKQTSSSKSYDETLMQTPREMKDEEIDEDKYFLLSLLPAFKRFNEDQKFYAKTEIMHVMRRIRQQEIPNENHTA